MEELIGMFENNDGKPTKYWDTEFVKMYMYIDDAVINLSRELVWMHPESLEFGDDSLYTWWDMSQNESREYMINVHYASVVDEGEGWYFSIPLRTICEGRINKWKEDFVAGAVEEE